MAVVLVPETPVNENHFSAGGKDQIGASWKLADVEAVSVSEPVNQAAHDMLGFRVLVANRPHNGASLLRSELIRHKERLIKKNFSKTSAHHPRVGLGSVPPGRTLLKLGDRMRQTSTSDQGPLPHGRGSGQSPDREGGVSARSRWVAVIDQGPLADARGSDVDDGSLVDARGSDVDDGSLVDARGLKPAALWFEARGSLDVGAIVKCASQNRPDTSGASSSVLDRRGSGPGRSPGRGRCWSSRRRSTGCGSAGRRGLR